MPDEAKGKRLDENYKAFNVLAIFIFCEYFVFWGGSTTYNIVVTVTTGMSALAVIAFAARTITKPAQVSEIASTIISGAVIIITDFATIYWLSGSSENFGHHLSKIDAFYFTLGTFTTAGTGSLAPISQFARLIVSAQYVVDIIFLGWIVATAISRLSAEPIP